jgi:hypothetical protein
MSDDRLFPSESVGGRCADDAQQFALSVSSAIRESWPINQVPLALAGECADLIGLGNEFRMRAEALMERANEAFKSPPAAPPESRE